MVNDTFRELTEMHSPFLLFPNTPKCWEFYEDAKINEKVYCYFSTRRLLEVYTIMFDIALLNDLHLPNAVRKTLEAWITNRLSKWLGAIIELFPFSSKWIIAFEIALMAPVHPYYLAHCNWQAPLAAIHPGARFVETMNTIADWPNPDTNHAELCEYLCEVEDNINIWPSSMKVSELSTMLENTYVYRNDNFLGALLIRRHIEYAKIRMSRDNPFLFPIGGMAEEVMSQSKLPFMVFSDGSSYDDFRFLYYGALKAVLDSLMQGGYVIEEVEKYGLTTAHNGPTSPENIAKRMVFQLSGYEYERFRLLTRKDWP